VTEIVRSTGEIEPMRWADPIPELCDLVNGLAQKHGNDPVVLLTTMVAAVAADDPKQMSTVTRTFVAFGFDFHRSKPVQQDTEEMAHG
jgi:hypothetical protein